MKKEKGFTLIELVMVIVIIGILAAVALPRFSSLRSDARKAACDGNIGAIRGALSAYYAKSAVSPSFDSSGRATSGFPLSVNGAAFRACFLTGGQLPTCPLSGSAIYVSSYTSAAGTLPEHTAVH